MISGQMTRLNHRRLAYIAPNELPSGYATVAARRRRAPEPVRRATADLSGSPRSQATS
jgi:hypothetical protein